MPSKFDFVSPDIVLREVDLSELPPDPPNEGALIIGQATKGPAMKPVKINNISDLESVFGVAYQGSPSGDIYRNGNTADRKSTRLNSSHSQQSRMPSSA